MEQAARVAFLTRLMTPLMKSRAPGQTAEAKGVSMMETGVAIEILNALAAITETPVIKIFTDKRSAFNNINHLATRGAARCCGWDQCNVLTHMHKDIQYRLRMTGAGVTEYISQDKGVVQGPRVGSQVYAFVENMITTWVGATTKSFCCTVPRQDGSDVKVEVHTQTHMGDMVDVCSTEEDAVNTTKKRNKAEGHYHHPLAAEKIMIIAKDAQGCPMTDIRLEAWESPGVRKVMPVMEERDTKCYTHGGFKLNQEGVSLTEGKIMEKQNEWMRKLKVSRATSAHATDVTNAKCVAALRYKAGLGTMSEEAMKKLETAYCDANRAKATHTKQVHSRFTFMEKKEGGAGVQLPTAVCAASTANTLYWSLNSRNTNCKCTTEAVWQLCWQQREDEEPYSQHTTPKVWQHGSTDPLFPSATRRYWLG
jgi:hypothetical protein